MRLLPLAALLLVACSGDSQPPNPLDAGTDASFTTERAPIVDLGPTPPDLGTLDAGDDVVDVFVATDLAPIVDRGALDVGLDAGADDVGDAGFPARDTGDARVDVGPDARLDCVMDENVRCTTHEECQVACLPRDPGSGFIAWCCPGRHHCISTADPRGCVYLP